MLCCGFVREAWYPTCGSAPVRMTPYLCLPNTEYSVHTRLVGTSLLGKKKQGGNITFVIGGGLGGWFSCGTDGGGRS